MTLIDDLWNTRGAIRQSVALALIQQHPDGPILLGSDHRLYRYKGGAWLPEGDAELGTRLGDLLGPELQADNLHALRTLARAGYHQVNINGAVPNHLLNVANGVIDLSPDKEPVLLPHNRNLHFVHQVPHNWVPDAQHATINEYFDSSFEPDEIDFMLELMGYVMLPYFNLKRAFLLYSPKPHTGKALALDTPVPTATGWKTQGSLEVGDVVYNAEGEPVAVEALSEIWLDRPCYEVTFRDGTSVVADKVHEWPMRDGKYETHQLTGQHDRSNRNPQTLGTPVLEGTLFDPLVPAYTLGVWLGDGTSENGAITNNDKEVWDNIEADGFTYGRLNNGNCATVRGLVTHLRGHNLLRNKHVPPRFLRASVVYRTALLAGLIDSDGYLDPRQGTVEYCSTNLVLADGVAELARSLGNIVTVKEGIATLNGVYISQKWRVCFTPSAPVGRVKRKQAHGQGKTNRWAKAEPTASVPVRCIQVEGGVYLVGRGMVPTHNSSFLRLLTDLVGPSNASNVTLQALDDDRFQRAELQGKFLNVAGDLSGRAPMNSAVFKALVGGDGVNVERKGQQGYTLVNTATLVFASNELPLTSDQTKAYFDRWWVVPFTKQHKYDPKFEDRFKGEGVMEALLNRVVRAAHALYHRREFSPPGSVQRETNRYAREANSVVRFLQDVCIKKPDGKVQSSVLYRRYQEWCKENGAQAVGKPKFEARMADQDAEGVLRVNLGGRTWFRGIGMPLIMSDPEKLAKTEVTTDEEGENRWQWSS